MAGTPGLTEESRLISESSQASDVPWAQCTAALLLFFFAGLKINQNVVALSTSSPFSATATAFLMGANATGMLFGGFLTVFMLRRFGARMSVFLTACLSEVASLLAGTLLDYVAPTSLTFSAVLCLRLIGGVGTVLSGLNIPTTVMFNEPKLSRHIGAVMGLQESAINLGLGLGGAAGGLFFVWGQWIGLGGFTFPAVVFAGVALCVTAFTSYIFPSHSTFGDEERPKSMEPAPAQNPVDWHEVLTSSVFINGFSGFSNVFAQEMVIIGCVRALVSSPHELELQVASLFTLPHTLTVVVFAIIAGAGANMVLRRSDSLDRTSCIIKGLMALSWLVGGASYSVAGPLATLVCTSSLSSARGMIITGLVFFGMAHTTGLTLAMIDVQLKIKGGATRSAVITAQYAAQNAGMIAGQVAVMPLSEYGGFDVVCWVLVVVALLNMMLLLGWIVAHCSRHATLGGLSQAMSSTRS